MLLPKNRQKRIRKINIISRNIILIHHFEILFSEVFIYIFAFGIPDIILGIMPNIYMKLLIILLIGFIGIYTNYLYAIR
jgi:hypothetical protein